MIPKEKIEHAANERSNNMVNQAVNITVERLKKYAREDFTAGAHFAEGEMKQIAQEFAEWCSLNGWELQGIGKWMNVMDFKIPADTRYTTEELYVKFEIEQNNGGRHGMGSS